MKEAGPLGRNPPSMSPNITSPDSATLLGVLHDARVEHVLIGGLAARLQGVSVPEGAVTIVPARFSRNLERLATALRTLDARARVSESGSTHLSAAGLRRLGRWPVATRLGALELDFEPPATAGHLDLFEGARRITVAPGLEVEVAAIADLVRIAEMRMDEPDRAALPALRAALTPLTAR